MKHSPLIYSMLFFLQISSVFCTHQKKIRPPAVAGQFYPETPEELSDNIDRLLANRERIEIKGDIKGIWVPHAGYMFCGQVAANGYGLIKGRDYDAVIIIGPSHYYPLAGGSIGDWDGYRTPLGEIAIDKELAQRIRSNTDLIECIPDAHKREHSVENQIPFIQSVLPGVPIVPIVVNGFLSYEKSKKIAVAIARSIKEKRVLVVASSDMSHYPNYRDAYSVDMKILNAVESFNPRKLVRVSSQIMKSNIEGLDCTMCGLSAVLITMIVSDQMGADKAMTLPYINSGDVSGERRRVVGYGAAIFYKDEKSTTEGEAEMVSDIDFSKQELKQLFQIARKSIECSLRREPVPDFSVESQNLLKKRGVFVTLTNHGRLRGCIGHFDPDYPLYQIVSRMAVAAATQDPRFFYNPVTIEEMADIEIKISVLSELKKIDSIDEIEVGKHGIWIRQGMRGGTYLPEVATEMGWNKIEFLEHCCVEKAGLPKDAWKKGAEIYIYTSQILSEKDI